MAQTPPPLGPSLVPPRPDREDPASRPLFAAFVLATVVAVVLGVLAIVALLRAPSSAGGLDAAAPSSVSSTAAPSTSTITPSPSISPSVRPKVDGAFRFLERVGGSPVRWNPCDPITYAINTAGASSDVRPDLRQALSRVTRATGIEFRSVGTTRETFIRAYQRMRFEGVIGKAALVVIWVDHADYQAILRRLSDPRPSLAFAKTMKGVYADQDQYFGGLIVMDADATARYGFGDFYAHGAVLLHELGHIMGLDHVRDPDQLMYSGRYPNFGLHAYGPGDLEGLRRLGMDAGCLD
jgi:Matrixin